ncbi:DUF502 domain-containing protein [Candidatus Dependentiae bacterium]|nr:DUF502 domain-containing protein [Candidatus Dependentiae bacterium]MCC7414750.1 DUF502 domain-containing protein [Campylobacterota bacterium]
MQKYGKSFLAFVWALFLSGLLTVAPIALTIVLFTISFRLIISWLEPISHWQPTFLQWIPHSEIVLALLFILVIGIFVQLVLLNPLIHALERLVFKTPLVSPIYSGIKQLVHAFSTQDHISFKRVVYIEFPRQGVYSIGFLTSEVPVALSPSATVRFFNVFIPTTPNPTSGFLVMFPENTLITSDLTRQEAMSLIISGGIIQPDRFLQR